MNEDSSIIRLRQPDAIDDPLTALLRSGARQLLEQAIEAEVAAFLASGKDLKLAMAGTGWSGMAMGRNGCAHPDRDRTAWLRSRRYPANPSLS